MLAVTNIDASTADATRSNITPMLTLRASPVNVYSLALARRFLRWHMFDVLSCWDPSRRRMSSVSPSLAGRRGANRPGPVRDSTQLSSKTAKPTYLSKFITFVDHEYERTSLFSGPALVKR